LDAFDTLLTLAEISLGLAGFAGIVVVFGLILYLGFAAIQFARMLFVRPGGL